jgi:hypothetical protein
MIFPFLFKQLNRVQRTAAESVMSDRALREIYLYPYGFAFLICSLDDPVSRFMLAQKNAKPGA